jgi:hypothetical protein
MMPNCCLKVGLGDFLAADNIAIVYDHGDSARETEDGQPCHHKTGRRSENPRIGGSIPPLATNF